MLILEIISFLLVGVDIAYAQDTAETETQNLNWTYTNQSDWANIPSASCNGSRQSPVNIQRGVPKGSNLVGLTFSSAWEMLGATGELKNTGRTIEFMPTSTGAMPTLTNHLGTYDLRKFYIHWGASDTEGSEHTVEGSSYDAEVHFVHEKQGAKSTHRDFYAVVGVFLQVDSTVAPSDAPWSMLDVPMRVNNSTNITNLSYQQLLPSDRSYYQYPGSLTIPLCTETVQWFVLRTPIGVPSAFLQELRMVDTSESRGLGGNVSSNTNSSLTSNFRRTQSLNGRNVYFYSSESSSGLRPTGGRVWLATVLLAALAAVWL